MGSAFKLKKLLLHNIITTRFHNIVSRASHTEVNSPLSLKNTSSTLGATLEEKLKMKLPRENRTASIYKVPANIRQIENKAYEPSIISIGPYHHGVQRFQPTEQLKWAYFHRLFNSGQKDPPNLQSLIDQLKDSEHTARSCYAEELDLSSDKFVQIMLIDGCFIVELFRELLKNDFINSCFMIRRWMLPVIRRDLIMLENQLPLFILSKIFELTKDSNTQTPIPNSSLNQLALRFFDPLMFNDPTSMTKRTYEALIEDKDHFLDLYRTSILPKRILSRGREPRMYRSMVELKESAIRIIADNNPRPLDVKFTEGTLRIPPVYFGDNGFTLFRNMVAYEQCHPKHKPDVAMYLFFLDKMIDSATDAEALHSVGIIQHALGGSEELARLVNKLCIGVSRDVEESYLHEMVQRIDDYCNNGYRVIRAKLVHDYFYNPWTSFASFSAILLVYLSLVQATTGIAQAKIELQQTGFWKLLGHCLIVPFSDLGSGILSLTSRSSSNSNAHEFKEINKHYELF